MGSLHLTEGRSHSRRRKGVHEGENCSTPTKLRTCAIHLDGGGRGVCVRRSPSAKKDDPGVPLKGGLAGNFSETFWRSEGSSVSRGKWRGRPDGSTSFRPCLVGREPIF